MKGIHIATKVWFTVFALMMLVSAFFSGYLIASQRVGITSDPMTLGSSENKAEGMSVISSQVAVEVGKTAGGALVREGAVINDRVKFAIPELGVAIWMPQPYRYMLLNERVDDQNNSKKAYTFGFVSTVDYEDTTGDTTGVLSLLAVPKDFYWPRGAYLGDMTSFLYDAGTFTAIAWHDDPRSPGNLYQEPFIAKSYRQTEKLSSAIYDIHQSYRGKVLDDSLHFAIVNLSDSDYPGFSIIHGELQKEKEVPGSEITEAVFKQIIEGIEGL